MSYILFWDYMVLTFTFTYLILFEFNVHVQCEEGV
jgi:hypothetical protein